jgi:DNA-binding CsgD family transcriptional regulator
MLDDELNSLIDHIYEAAVVPEVWPKVLGRLTALADSDGAALFTIDASRNVKFATCGIHDAGMPKLIEQGWMERNSRVRRGLAKRHPGFLTDLDMFSLEEMRTDPFYDFVRANAGGWCVGTLIPMPSNDTVTLTIDRADSKGAISKETVAKLDQIRPHLARAGLMACRLGMERAKSMVAALEAVGLPAAVVRSDGRVLAANVRLSDLRNQIVFRAFDHLSLAHGDADALYRNALSESRQTAMVRTSSIPLPGTETDPAAIAHLIPTKGSAADLFSFASSLLVVTPLAAPNAPSEDVLNGLFDLTPAEVRVTQALVAGRSVAEIAASTGSTEATVRVQVRSVLAKTGTNRQAQLVALLSSARSIGPTYRQ